MESDYVTCMGAIHMSFPYLELEGGLILSIKARFMIIKADQTSITC